MIPSRVITGIVLLILGLILTVVGVFTIAPLVWGIIFVILGLYMLLVDNEDKIEPIKSRRKK